MTDRFHVLLNLQEALKRLFERKQEQLKHLATWEPAKEEQTSQAYEGRAEGAPEPAQPAQRQSRREKRKRRFDDVIALHEQGASQVAIAALLGVHRETVRRYINATSFPEIVRPGKRSKLDLHKAYLRERWNAGQHNIKQLVAELRERGYRQGETIVYDYLRSVREQPAWLEAYTATKKAQTPRDAQRVWLLVIVTAG